MFAESIHLIEGSSTDRMTPVTHSDKGSRRRGTHDLHILPLQREPGPAAQGELCFGSVLTSVQRPVEMHQPCLTPMDAGPWPFTSTWTGKTTSYSWPQGPGSQELLCGSGTPRGSRGSPLPSMCSGQAQPQGWGLQAKLLTSRGSRLPSPAGRTVLERSPAGEPLGPTLGQTLTVAWPAPAP